MPPGRCAAPCLCATIAGASVVRSLPWMRRTAAIVRGMRTARLWVQCGSHRGLSVVALPLADRRSSMRHILGPHARSTGRGRWRRLAAVVVPAVSFAVIARGDVDAAQTTALAVQVPTPARAVYGGDGREHVDYDLLTTNAFTAPVKLVSLQVRGGGR